MLRRGAANRSSILDSNSQFTPMPRISPRFQPPVTEWTKIPNSHLDHLLPILSNPELRLLLVISRRAYGLRRIHVPLNASYEQLEVWAGIKRSSVHRGLTRLASRGLIGVELAYPQSSEIDAQK